MSNLTIVQLISEQTIQNLLPVLRLRPTKLVHLVTPKTAPRSRFVEESARTAGVKPTVRVVQLSAMPGIQETYNAVSALLEQAKKSGDEAVINFTGGTKLMSIGAYASARVRETPSLYVDTQDACFVDGGTSPTMSGLFGGDWSFTPIMEHLTLDVIGVANGVARITPGKLWEPMLPLAENLFANFEDEQAVWSAFYGPAGRFSDSLGPRNPEEWLKVLDNPIPLPREVARLAVEAGLFRSSLLDGTVLLPDSTRAELTDLLPREGAATALIPDFARRYFAAVDPIKHSISFLTGGWWEVIVCDAAHKSGHFRDLRWSAQVGIRDGPELEEDVLGVQGVELLSINCKRGGARARLLPLLDEVRARAAGIGGSFNRRFLAVRIPPAGRVAANLQYHAGELGIGILTGDNICDPGIFSKR